MAELWQGVMGGRIKKGIYDYDAKADFGKRFPSSRPQDEGSEFLLIKSADYIVKPLFFFKVFLLFFLLLNPSVPCRRLLFLS